MQPGKIILSCGCQYTADMGDINDLHMEWDEEICTRDPDRPFAMAVVSGVYCPKCRWEGMRPVTFEKEDS
jgi:hypothetical protein